jgi:PKD repeat protein
MRWSLVVLLALAFARVLVPVGVADDRVPRSKSRPPVAVVTADVQDGPVPLRVCFDASKSYHPEGKAVVFRWDFGDGRGTASEPRACHEYVQPGLYAAMMTVTDEQGSKDSRVLVVSVREVQ